MNGETSGIADEILGFGLGVLFIVTAGWVFVRLFQLSSKEVRKLKRRFPKL